MYDHRVKSSLRPIFLFSLPRAGSTLLQRLLASNPHIATSSEPWILLPLLNLTNRTSGIAEYSHRLASIAVEDFVLQLPNGRQEFDLAIRTLTIELYRRSCRNEEVFFVDKTPRYYWIIHEIVRVFPDAKFIFLVRPPHQVLASIIDTWGNGRLANLDGNMVDIDLGIPLLADALRRHRERSLTVRFEELICEPEEVLSRISAYLDVENNFPALRQLKTIQIPGRMGDPTGAVTYESVSRDPLTKWEHVFSSRVRQLIATRIFSHFKADDIAEHGIEKSVMLRQINTSPRNRKGWQRDIIDYTTASLGYWRQSNRFCSSRPGFPKGKFLS